MCGCGKYADEDGTLAGVVSGVFEMHSRTQCVTKRVTTWRSRLFLPMARFFYRLAGGQRLSEQAHVVVQAAEQERFEEFDNRRRNDIRAALKDHMDKHWGPN